MLMYLEEKSKSHNRFCFVLKVQWCQSQAHALGSLFPLWSVVWLFQTIDINVTV